MLRRAAAGGAAARPRTFEARLDAVEELSKRLDTNLQSTKMVLRLRDEALKKRGGGGGGGGTTTTGSSGTRRWRRSGNCECPPEVVRVRVEMQALRARVEELEAENDVHPAKGRVATLASELEDIRRLRVEEGDGSPRAMERAAESDALREAAETSIAAIEARREASERLATDAEETAAAAEAARAEAEDGRAAAETAKALAEENARACRRRSRSRSP